MGKCINCKKWYKDEYLTAGEKDWGVCAVSTKETDNLFMHATCSVEGIYGELITNKAFGCVLFENK